MMKTAMTPPVAIGTPRGEGGDRQRRGRPAGWRQHRATRTCGRFSISSPTPRARPGPAARCPGRGPAAGRAISPNRAAARAPSLARRSRSVRGRGEKYSDSSRWRWSRPTSSGAGTAHEEASTPGVSESSCRRCTARARRRAPRSPPTRRRAMAAARPGRTARSWRGRCGPAPKAARRLCAEQRGHGVAAAKPRPVIAAVAEVVDAAVAAAQRGLVEAASVVAAISAVVAHSLPRGRGPRAGGGGAPAGPGPSPARRRVSRTRS